MMKKGVLPKQQLQKLFVGGYITGIDEKYINPASIDMPLSDEAYRLESIFLPLTGEKVRDLLPLVGARRHPLSEPLEVGVPYLVRVDGSWKLPKSMRGRTNPKSSTGRLGFFCRVVADGVSEYDVVSGSGDKSEIWILARPDYFPVIISAGLAISQIRFSEGNPVLSSDNIEQQNKKDGLIFDSNKKDILEEKEVDNKSGQILLTLHVGDGMGWECRGTRKVLDLGKEGHYNPNDFFKQIDQDGSEYFLRKGNFYILSTREYIMVPPNLSSELMAVDTRLGEFRSHAAGYIDPGWGYGVDGKECGRPITLEVIPQEDMLVRDGQSIARIQYEYMKEIPETIYDSANSNYTDQHAAKLSKHFMKHL